MIGIVGKVADLLLFISERSRCCVVITITVVQGAKTALRTELAYTADGRTARLRHPLQRLDVLYLLCTSQKTCPACSDKTCLLSGNCVTRDGRCFTNVLVVTTTLWRKRAQETRQRESYLLVVNSCCRT